jgi:hypothetical protein
VTTTTTIPSNGQMRKTLASQLDRMDKMLDGLSEGLNEAVAAAVQAAVGQAVRAAVQQALAEVLANPELRQRLATGDDLAVPATAPPPAEEPAAPRRPGMPVSPSRGGVGGAVRRAWSWACGAVTGATLAVCRPVAQAARRGWRATAALAVQLWRWRGPALEGLCAAAAVSVLIPSAWPAAAAAGGWLAGAACTLAHATMGLLA